MSQTEKAGYYNRLKAAGVEFSKHYREYSTEELKQACDRLDQAQPAPEPVPQPEPVAAPQFDAAAFAAAYEQAVADEQPEPEPPAAPTPTEQAVPHAKQDPAEMPGQRQNQPGGQLQPIRVDENGLTWFQEEVRKPSYPKPRGRRVLKYLDTGVKEVTAKNGEYLETFEVAGDRASRPAEVKITLPSYQVGIYLDPRFPQFKIHVYNENRGFDLFDVQNFYGGAELVPQEIKRIYVENVLCYDIRTTVRAINTEFRQQQLAGRI